jgi:hypothetical protein
MSEHIKTERELYSEAYSEKDWDKQWVSLTWLIKKVEEGRSDKRRPMQYRHAMSNLKQDVIDEAGKN